MRTGRLSIGRGYREPAADNDPSPLTLVPPAPTRPDVEARLGAMERLVRLYEIGALTPEEFEAEKRLIIGDVSPATPVHFVPAHPRRARRGPSLLGRMLSWPFLLLSLVLGLAFSLAVQPEATRRFATQLWRAIAG